MTQADFSAQPARTPKPPKAPMGIGRRIGVGVFWVLCLAVAAVSFPKFIPSVIEALPHLHIHFEARPAALITHIFSASIAMAILPFQAWAGLRIRRRSLHRWLGRVYVLACVVGGISGIALAIGGVSLSANSGFALLGALWAGSTLAGLFAARAGKIADHRRWMIRSGALTFAAVTLRLYMPFGFIAGYEQAEIFKVVAWACWVPNLLIAELLWNRKMAAKPA